MFTIDQPVLLWHKNQCIQRDILNLIANVIWWLGINNRIIALLVVSMACWFVPLCVSLLFFAFWVHNKLVKPYNAFHRKDGSYEFFNNLFKLIAIGGTAYWLCFYSVAVWCFIKLIRKSRWDNQRLGISHAVASAKNDPFNKY
ncbi:uncharacterized protein LOC129571997 isoform X3 [Sitodiplosis mosellana]|uniref:uncharacterized protein LOC129571997 isoform X3 n=1 Tax=Sitodiplosis mosellana TaxID=263140 RepID=UPI0024441818|nr:uncharacterized protein LOC129571997 isoform X3 [Sitodiplosis mosellana]XP_055307874.1 uncharacterized protein LOC129571997 isoform X3 [Sitodiplosis mosellana]